MPYGLGFPKFHTGEELDVSEIEDPTTKTKNNKEAVTKAEVSALSLRHTFAQDPNSTDPKLLPTPRSAFPKPFRDKNVRNMRLRPRQVLCSKCKQGIHSDTGKPVEKPEPPPLTMNLRRRRAAEPPKAEPPKKGRKTEVQKEQSKASPVIKISFNTPQGQGTVVEIPSKAHGEVPSSEAEENEDTEANQENTPKEIEDSADEFEKLKKAWKKAKAAQKAKASAENSENGTKQESKDTKRGKHKKKKKHKKKDEDTRDESPLPNDQENLPEKSEELENEQATDTNPTLPKDGHVENVDKVAEFAGEWTNGEDSKSVDMDMYPLYGSHFKENSINVPNKLNDGSSFMNHKTPSRRNSCTDSDSVSQMSMNSVSSYVGNNEPLKLACYSDISSDDESHNSDAEDNANIMNYPDPLAHHMGMSMDGNSHHASPNGACAGTEGIQIGRTHPLMMRIQTRNETKCETDDGRTLMVNDIVWGKIHGFPWWPGKIVSITISQRDNGTLISQTAHVSWYGSSTMSHMPCSELYPFLEDFKIRFNKKKRGPYKVAIKQATLAAQKCINSPSKMEMIQDCTVDIEMLED